MALLAGALAFVVAVWPYRPAPAKPPQPASAPVGGAAAKPPPGPGGQPLPQRPTGLGGEFEPQSALILGCNELIWAHPDVFAALVAATHCHVPVIGLVTDEVQLRLARGTVKGLRLPAGAVRFVTAPADTMWVRDYGPFFVGRAGGAALVDGEYSSLDDLEDRPQDDAIPKWLGAGLHLPVAALPLKIEGGNLLSNGDGLCVATTALIQRNLSRGCDPFRIEALLREHLGIQGLIFLNELAGEETGHVDMFVTFLAPNVAVVAQCSPLDDALNAKVLDEAATVLSRLRTSLGPMRVHRVPMPPPRGGVWRSYTNVLFANGVLLVPTYSDVPVALEAAALALYRRLLPGWTVVGVNSDGLAAKGGALHCISLNVPAFVPIDRLAEQAARGPRPKGLWSIGGGDPFAPFRQARRVDRGRREGPVPVRAPVRRLEPLRPSRGRRP